MNTYNAKHASGSKGKGGKLPRHTRRLPAPPKLSAEETAKRQASARKHKTPSQLLRQYNSWQERKKTRAEATMFRDEARYKANMHKYREFLKSLEKKAA